MSILFMSTMLLALLACAERDPEDEGSTGTTTDGGSTTGTTDSGWLEEAEACERASEAGFWDAHVVISDCECAEDAVYENWHLSEYSTDQEKNCYIGGWGGLWQQYCTEMCEEVTDIQPCCQEMFDWATAQFVHPTE